MDTGEILEIAAEVLKIEAEPNDANYKACVVGAGGPQVETRIDPLTGAILSQETKPCLGGDALGPVNLNAIVGGGSSDDDGDDRLEFAAGPSRNPPSAKPARGATRFRST